VKLLFGDSHVALLSSSLEQQPDGWKILGVGGATCVGILNDDSVSGARKLFKETWQPGDHVVIMLGECDVVDLLPSDHDALEKGTARLAAFVDELRVSGSDVTVCTVLPHTSVFSLYNVSPSETRFSLERWNSMLGPVIDIYTPLLDRDGFLPLDLRYSDSTGERHLNKIGYLRVWDIVRTAC
jgi:hypothetical protein